MTRRKYIYEDDEVPNVSATSVGNKARVLGHLKAGAIPVPAFYVIGSDAFKAHLSQDALAKIGTLSVLNASNESMQDHLRNLRQAIESAQTPNEVEEEVREAYNGLTVRSKEQAVAVRSSASQEDLPGASFAGQFTSILGVVGEAKLIQAVKHCWSSYYNDRAVRYRKSHGIETAEPSFAVIVQTQIFPDKAGVLFTRHPLDPGADTCYIEANFGTGESVVGGLVRPDSYTISRATREIIAAEIREKLRMSVVSREAGATVVEIEQGKRNSEVLDQNEVRELVKVSLKIEDMLGLGQDIEWAIDGEQLWITQSRPITGLK